MDSSSYKMPPQQSLFQVYLRLRPSLHTQNPLEDGSRPWLLIGPPSPSDDDAPPVHTHITLQPPNDSRKRAVEKFGFTKVFQEAATQLDIFESSGTPSMIKNLLNNGKDGLVATLGVTGSGKTHTILGSRSQRGLTQMTLDVLFRSINANICFSTTGSEVIHSLQSSDPSEARISTANSFLETIYGELDRGRGSRAHTPMAGGYSRSQTPLVVGADSLAFFSPSPKDTLPPKYPQLPKPADGRLGRSKAQSMSKTSPLKDSALSKIPSWIRPGSQRSPAKLSCTKESMLFPKRHLPTRPSALPSLPDVTPFKVDIEHSSDYVVLVSMYEVYNDRIFDLLSSSTPNNGTMTRQGTALLKDLRRRPLLFKSTEMSPDRKVVAGLHKVVCGTYEEAMMVLETGLAERRVTGTGSNTASSRSHGFFCVEVKRRDKNRHPLDTSWTGGILSIVDLAGSERARNAKTTGSTLAEAGKINESLMYLGQCLQVQSEQQDGSKPIVPFRQCKLTELLFTNSFSGNHIARVPQKAVMIVTADPQGDFNATSQILRYSALAREVTVPRIPSVTSTILNGIHYPSRTLGRQAQHGEQLFSAEELQQAANEIARVAEECDQLTVRLAEEEIKRQEAELQLEATLQAAEEKALLVEQEIREECWAQMEADMERERERWRISKDQDRARAEGYLDLKIGIVEKGVAIEVHEDSQEVAIDGLERENASLRRKIDDLERQLNLRSPTKVKTKPDTALTPLKENKNPISNPFLSALRNSSLSSAVRSGEDSFVSPTKGRSSGLGSDDLGMRKVSVPKTPATGKKVRKLTTRKWDFEIETADDDGF